MLHPNDAAVNWPIGRACTHVCMTKLRSPGRHRLFVKRSSTLSLLGKKVKSMVTERSIRSDALKSPKNLTRCHTSSRAKGDPPVCRVKSRNRSIFAFIRLSISKPSHCGTSTRVTCVDAGTVSSTVPSSELARSIHLIRTDSSERSN